MRQLTIEDAISQSQSEAEAEVQAIYAANVAFITGLLKQRYMVVLQKAARNGDLLWPSPSQAAQSIDVYAIIRRSLLAWIDRERPGSPRTYIGWALRAWASRINRKPTSRLSQWPEDSHAEKGREEGFELDLDQLLAGLPEPLREVARCTMTGNSQQARAKAMGVSVKSLAQLQEQLEAQVVRAVYNEGLA